VLRGWRRGAVGRTAAPDGRRRDRPRLRAHRLVRNPRRYASSTGFAQWSQWVSGPTRPSRRPVNLAVDPAKGPASSSPRVWAGFETLSQSGRASTTRRGRDRVLPVALVPMIDGPTPKRARRASPCVSDGRGPVGKSSLHRVCRQAPHATCRRGHGSSPRAVATWPSAEAPKPACTPVALAAFLQHDRRCRPRETRVRSTPDARWFRDDPRAPAPSCSRTGTERRPPSRATIYAEVAGAASTADAHAHHRPRTGRVPAPHDACMELAGWPTPRSGRPRWGHIDRPPGPRRLSNDLAEARAITKVFGEPGPLVTSTKGVTGTRPGRRRRHRGCSAATAHHRP